MTDKEIVKRAKEAEKRTSFGELVHSSISKGVNSAYGIGFIEGMVEYRNSLQEEPISEGRDIFDNCLNGEEKFILPQKISGNIDCENCRYSSACALGDIQECIIDKPVREELEKFADESSIDYRKMRDYQGLRDPIALNEVEEANYNGIMAGAQWKEEQFEKNRLKHCNSITNEQAELEQGFIDQHLDKYQRMPTFLDAIEYGMRLQKEQMMAKAIDGTARPDDNEIWCNLTSSNLKDGDEVKVVIIKKGVEYDTSSS